jgi:hypothetical protein
MVVCKGGMEGSAGSKGKGELGLYFLIMYFLFYLSCYLFAVSWRFGKFHRI